MLQVFNFALILDRKYWIVGPILGAAVTKEKQILSKAIQKPAQFAAVENAARVIGNTVQTSLQAGCEFAPLQAGCEITRLQAGCEVAPLLVGCEVAPLLAGCEQASALEADLLAGCIADNVTAIRGKAAEEPLLAGCINDGVAGIAAEK